MKILLTAASGFVGERMLEDLLSAGHEVIPHVHSERSRDELRRRYPELPVISADVADLQGLRKSIPNGIEAIIYLPGLLREFPNKGITFEKAHVVGVKNLLTIARGVGASRWIQMSALGVSSNGTTGYYRTKWQAEELVRGSGLAWTILRPSVIFDDRPRKQHSFVSEIVKALRLAPFIPVLGNGKYLLQPVSLDDVSQTIVQSLAMSETIGQTYELGGPDTLTYTEIVTSIAGAMHSRKPRVHIPLPIVRFIASLLDRFSWFPITRGQIAMLTDGNYIRDANEYSRWTKTFRLPLKKFRESISLSI